MTDTEHVNGQQPARSTLIPGPREPRDAVPPGVWRGPTDQPSADQAAEARPRFHAVRRIVADPRTRAAASGAVTAARSVARQGAYVGKGALLSRSRRRDERGTARHERMMRAAEVGGDHAAVQEWAKLAAQHRQERHERRMARWRMVPQVAKGVLVGASLTLGGLLTLGIVLAVTSKNLHEVMVPLRDLFEVIRWIYGVADVMWRPALLLTPAFVILSWWRNGRQHAEVPAWLKSPAQREQSADRPITPSILVTALRDLGISELRKKIKDMADAGAAMLSPIRAAGCGIEVDITLPSGVSTSEVRAKREKLAENCGRHKHELFITIPETPRTVRLWIADSGALDEPIGPSPLVTDPASKADYRTGRAPWGQSLRGERSTVSLFQRHILVTGISNQGKTASLRALILWLALDPRVRLWLADFKGVGDWGMFDGIAEVLIQGPTDEHVIAGTHMAEAGVAEMQARTTLMQKLTAEGWSQEKVLADPRFAPLVLVFDEAQKAYGCGAIGEDKRPYGGKGATSRYFQAIKAIHDQGRAVNVTTAEGVQDPTNENLPVRTREGNHIRCSLVVGTEAQAVMALGENAVNAGAAPHELRQGADKGTLVIAGDVTAFDAPRGQVFTTIRTHFIGDKDAAAIAQRATARRKGTVTTRDEQEQPQAPDPLADVATVLGDTVRMLSEEVLHHLKNLRPAAYGAWTTRELKAVLAPHGAEARAYGGKMHISRARVLEAIAERDADEPGSAANEQ